MFTLIKQFLASARGSVSGWAHGSVSGWVHGGERSGQPTASQCAQVLPKASIVTPNLFETQVLSGRDEITSVEQLKDAAKAIYDQGVPVVVAKAGTLLGTGTALDVYYDGEQLEVLEVPAVGSERVSGAGCTLAAAITAQVAKGVAPLQAVRDAKQVVLSAIENRMHGNAPFSYVYQGGASATL